MNRRAHGWRARAHPHRTPIPWSPLASFALRGAAALPQEREYPHAMENAPRESRLNLAVIVEIARTVERREALAQSNLRSRGRRLGLAGASISLVRHDGGEARLDSIAAVGQLSSFMLEMSAPLDKLTDASRAALGGEPLFVGNPHGVDSDAAKSDGVARWRNGFGAHAYAVLGLTVLEGTLGVITLEWPEPYLSRRRTAATSSSSPTS